MTTAVTIIRNIDFDRTIFSAFSSLVKQLSQTHPDSSFSFFSISLRCERQVARLHRAQMPPTPSPSELPGPIVLFSMLSAPPLNMAPVEEVAEAWLMIIQRNEFECVLQEKKSETTGRRWDGFDYRDITR